MCTVALIFIRSGYNLVIFGAIFAVLSFLRTQRFHDRTGLYPWRIPPVVWAIASFFVYFFGTLLSVIACATTKVPGRGAGYGGAPGGGPFQGYNPSADSDPTSMPGYSSSTGYGPGPGLDLSPAPFGAAPQATAALRAKDPGSTAPGIPTAHPPAWHPDPRRRHQHRYWDGTQWTHHVADNGISGIDPV